MRPPRIARTIPKGEMDATVPIADFLELYDAAHAVIDKIRLHVDHAEYEGGMNAVEDFREIAARLCFEHAEDIDAEDQ